MIVVRAATTDDVDGILDLFSRAGSALHGMSSLRPDREMLTKRTHSAELAFASMPEHPGESDYFFVLVDTDIDRIIGTGAVMAGVGLTDAFYSYKIVSRVYSSRELGVYNKVPTLVLSNDYTGMTEVASLFVDADYRKSRAGKLMSLARLLFITEHSNRFSERVFAEMRGYQTEDGRVPVWEGLGQHFFSLPFEVADDITASGNKTFIAELMPSHPIYIPLLPSDAQEAIGRVHENTLPARRMLEKEGFRYHGYVDIFDGGPTIEAVVGDLRSAIESHHYTAQPGTPEAGPDLLIINQRLSGFRALLAQGTVVGGTLILRQDTIDALGIEAGETVRMMTLDPPRTGGIEA